MDALGHNFATKMKLYQEEALEFKKQGKCDEALRCLINAQSFAKKAQNLEDVALIFGQIGEVYGILNKRDIAVSYFQAGARIVHQIETPQARQIEAVTTYFLAIQFSLQNKQEMAREGYFRALKIMRGLKDQEVTAPWMKDAIKVLTEQRNTFEQKAKAWKEWDREDEALKSFVQALVITKGLKGKDHYRNLKTGKESEVQSLVEKGQLIQALKILPEAYKKEYPKECSLLTHIFRLYRP